MKLFWGLAIYWEALGEIEAQFGLKWLTEKAKAPQRGNVHPIPHLWAEARDSLKAIEKNEDRELTLRLARFFDIGRCLKFVKGLPGFVDAISPEFLKHPTHWTKRCYMARVAAMGVRAGYAVRFLPERPEVGLRTADLLMIRDGKSIYVECKKRDNYVRVEEVYSEDMLDIVNATRLDTSTQGCPSNEFDFDITVLTIGRRDAELSRKVMETVREKLAGRADGEFFFDDAAILVRRTPTPPPAPYALELDINTGQITRTLIPGLTNDEYRSGSSVVYREIVLHAHQLKQAVNSVTQARRNGGQIPDGEVGLLYIDLDTSRLPQGLHLMYMTIIGRSLERKIFRPGCNTRLGGIVLTADAFGVEQGANGAHVSLTPMALCRNLYAPAMNRIIVPGIAAGV